MGSYSPNMNLSMAKLRRSEELANNIINPAAGGRRPPNLRIGLSPAAGYAERYTHSAAEPEMNRR